LEEVYRSTEEEQNLKELCSFIGCSPSDVVPDKVSSTLKSVIPISHKKVYMRRLSALADYEGKTRIIAIAD
jgi:hypothetical protein